MRHVCPECNGVNVRRSSTPVAERTWRNNFSSRYRCRDCLHDFWAIRGRTYAAGVTLVVAIVLAVIAVFVMEQMFKDT
jgi:uncharacterized protein with PIN domain